MYVHRFFSIFNHGSPIKNACKCKWGCGVAKEMMKNKYCKAKYIYCTYYRQVDPEGNKYSEFLF